MQTYFVLFKILTFYSVTVSCLQEVLNVAKCVADIHRELSNSCVFIMKWMENNKVRRRNVVILEN